MNPLYKIGSIAALVLFYLVCLLSIFMLASNIGYIWYPNSAFTASLGAFDPLYTYFELHFDTTPVVYTEPSFRWLSFASEATMTVFALLFLWFLHQLLKNIHHAGLFTESNVTVLFRFGLTVSILGTAFGYMDSRLSSAAITALDVRNGSIEFTSLYHLDMLFGGIVLLIIASALKTAVRAVEENKKTI
ncbi:DUF2975 domain-containing protein [Halobacillus sp. ACCC02827]|uniref:DUF2975 domain-containing protein n=1 Tax=Halobacillus sp. ACCC02827 TaxID=3052090 RepID=UPI002570D7ED|nr:DUF2975 domain-containing protein [Halobacillus sp. ACCC02827]WJE16929.1 DUF2975 domain-containing protein [Halobacillus sp. ACCC02827]